MAIEPLQLVAGTFAGAGGLAGALVAARRWPVERGKTAIDTEAVAVETLRSVLLELRGELSEKDVKIARLRAELAIVERDRDELYRRLDNALEKLRELERRPGGDLA